MDIVQSFLRQVMVVPRGGLAGTVPHLRAQVLEAVEGVKKALRAAAEGDSPSTDPVTFAPADNLPRGKSRDIFKMEAMVVIRKFIHYCFGIPVSEIPLSVTGIRHHMLAYLERLKAEAAANSVRGSGTEDSLHRVPSDRSIDEHEG